MSTINFSEIFMVNVLSSSIESIGFKDGVLKVKFKNGGIYLYVDVLESDYNFLITSAESVGKSFSVLIKNNSEYKCIKIG